MVDDDDNVTGGNVSCGGSDPSVTRNRVFERPVSRQLFHTEARSFPGAGMSIVAFVSKRMVMLHRRRGGVDRFWWRSCENSSYGQRSEGSSAMARHRCRCLPDGADVVVDQPHVRFPR